MLLAVCQEGDPGCKKTTKGSAFGLTQSNHYHCGFCINEQVLVHRVAVVPSIFHLHYFFVSMIIFTATAIGLFLHCLYFLIKDDFGVFRNIS